MNISNENIRLSLAISWMRFPLIFMIVLLHCYCAIDAYNHPLYFKLVYPWGLWLGETGVPAFFFISGFLFFLSQKTYSQKILSRVSSLFIPYLFWNGLILVVYIILDRFVHPIFLVDKAISNYNIIDYFRAFIDRGDWNNGNGVPLLCPFWYIRNLMILCILSPLLYYIIRYLKWLFILLLFGWWITIPYNGMLASSLLFFCLGAYFSIQQINPLKIVTERHVLFLTIWATLFFFDWTSHSILPLYHGLYIHRLSIVFNIFMLFLLGSYWGDNNYKGKDILNKSSFWIYAVHYPLTIVVKKISAYFIVYLQDWQVLGFYFLSVICVTAICVFSYMISNKLYPQFLSIITGNRT